MKSTYLFICISFLFFYIVACNSKGNDDASEDYPEKSGHPNKDEVHMIHDDTLWADSSNKMENFSDKNFMNIVTQSTFAEIAGRDMAQIKTQNEAVKGFGKMLSNDHKAAYEELKNVAILAAYSLPTSIAQEHKEMLNRLSAKKDFNFDTAYINQMFREHTKLHKIFAIAAQSAEDNNLRSFALKNEPTIQKHLEEAKRLRKEFVKE